MDAQIVNSWRNKNRHLFFQFPEQWVAFTPELGIIEHNADLDRLIDTLKSKGFTFKDFVMKFVHQSEVPIRPVRFAPIRIYGVRKKEWTPDYLIGLKVDQTELNESMLIDSGADISVISKKVGAILGLQVTKSEILNEVGGVGGGIIEYAPRKITFIIDNIEVDAPVAWLQDEKYNELIIGREGIFDAFDIEFKQADEKIIFKRRTNTQVF